jgi:three-Cys-motif partner protein
LKRICVRLPALQRKFPELWYIDAFAGTGQRTERIPARRGGLLTSAPESIIRRRGSAKIAIDVYPSFDRLIFVEKRPRAVAALRELQKLHPDRNIEVIAGDTNVEIPKLISSVNWQLSSQSRLSMTIAMVPANWKRQ